MVTTLQASQELFDLHTKMAQKSSYERRQRQRRQKRRRRFLFAVPIITGACSVTLSLWNATTWHDHKPYSRTLFGPHSSSLPREDPPELRPLWNNTESTDQALPGWYQDYVIWHRDTMKQLRPDNNNWKEFRYLLVRCVVRDRVCGGAADRLRTIPAILYLASRSKRLLLIYWTRPAPLEEFLVPNQIDWRLPNWLVPLLQADTPRLPWSFVLEHVQNGAWDRRMERLISIRTLYQGVLDYYDSVNEVPLQVSYHAIWTATFQPSLPVLQKIHSTMSELHLSTNQYVGLHIRSLYQINATMKNHAELENAVHCTAALLVNDDNNNLSPIFVTSDAPSSTHYAVQYGTTALGLRMVHHLAPHPPLHLDRGQDFLQSSSRDWQNHGVEEYYPVFVDLYILAASRCISAGMGGYGVWASAIGQHSECFFQRNTTTISFCPKPKKLYY